MHTQKKAFTLIELIVTVVILSVLSTIAFLSYSYVVSDSKNSKTKNQMAQIWRSIELWKTEWIDMLSFVNEKPQNQLWDPLIAWTGSMIGTDYNAWEPNYAAIGFKEDNSDYKIGVTKKLSSKYEIAWNIEDPSIWDQALLVWNYIARTSLQTSSTGSISANSNKVFILEKNNWIRKWDTITALWWTSIQMFVVNVEWKELHNDVITMSETIPIWTTHIQLATDETPWLIMWRDINSNTWIITDLWEVLPY